MDCGERHRFLIIRFGAHLHWIQQIRKRCKCGIGVK
jgi:hypothetical protein